MFETIGFVGLGLMGGSIAKSIKKYNLANKIVAYDIDELSLEKALKEGVIDVAAPKVGSDFSDCDLVFLCCPVKVNVHMANALTPYLKAHCILTDIGSTKQDIHHAMATYAPKQPFIGGHPMTGSEKIGYSAADPMLFENIYYVLTPSAMTYEDDLEKMIDFVKAIDSLPIQMNPEQHDQATAAISHVPQIIASSLVNAVKDMDKNNGYMHTLAAGGFRDLTRIASGSPEMWEAICLANKEPILQALDTTLSAINRFYYAMQISDGDELIALLSNSKDYRDSFNYDDPGMLPKTYSITVDVDDVPGIIAQVSTTLYEAGINIKNVGIVNRRESSNGVMKIQLENQDQMDRSVQVLSDMGYTIYR